MLKTGVWALILPVIFLFFPAKTHADTIYLKNGKSLEGLIGKENKNGVEIDVGDGTVIFGTNEIERIDRATPAEIEEIKKKWKASRTQVEKTTAQVKEEKEKASKKWEAIVDEERRRGAESRYMEANTKVVRAVPDGKGHLSVEVVLNGSVHASLLVDTGCPVVLLTANLAQDLGVDLKNTRNVSEVVVLNGRHKVRDISLKSVKLGEAEEINVNAQVMLETDNEIKQTMKDGLLGMSFLDRFNVTLDQKQMKLILKPHSDKKT